MFAYALPPGWWYRPGLEMQDGEIRICSYVGGGVLSRRCRRAARWFLPFGTRDMAACDVHQDPLQKWIDSYNERREALDGNA